MPTGASLSTTRRLQGRGRGQDRAGRVGFGKPVHRISPRLLQKIKAYYVQEGFSKAMSFEDYLRGLHADYIAPDEVLDVIEGLRGDNPPR